MFLSFLLKKEKEKKNREKKSKTAPKYHFWSGGAICFGPTMLHP